MKLLPSLLAVGLLASCQKDENAQKAPSSPESPGEKVAIVIETSKGTIHAELDGEIAPVTVKNFLSYIDKEHYDDTIFHRVMPTFMIQGGGFAMVDELPKEKETGAGIFNESPQTPSNSRGTLAMARTNDPNSATAQFFINVVDNESLDHPNNGGYAVFGKVTEGMDVVDAIKDVETGEQMALSLGPDGRFAAGSMANVPREPVFIKSIRRVGKSE